MMMKIGLNNWDGMWWDGMGRDDSRAYIVAIHPFLYQLYKDNYPFIPAASKSLTNMMEKLNSFV